MAAMIFGGAGLAYSNFAAPGAYALFPVETVITGTDPVLDLTGRVEVPIGDIGDRTAVLLFIGQSLSVNQSPTPYVPVNTNIDQLNIHDGKLYRAKDPLLGINVSGGPVTAQRGTWLLRLADNLISDGHYDRVVIVPMAIGNTRGNQWSDETQPPHLFNRINTVALRMRDAGLPCTAIHWGLGESDNSVGTTQAAQEAAMQKVFAEFKRVLPSCPILVAQESYYNGVTSAAVLAAQASVVDGVTVFAGENVDSIGSAGRYDNTHLNDAGAAQRAVIAEAALVSALNL